MARQGTTIPPEIVYAILKYLSMASEEDRHTISALSQVSRYFLYPCRSILFATVVFDLSTQASVLRCDILGQLFDSHPECRAFVRRLVFTVGPFPPMGPNTAAATYNARWERQLAERIGHLFGDQTRRPLSSVLAHWINISTFSMSFSGASSKSQGGAQRSKVKISWTQFSPDVSAQLKRIMGLDTLQNLMLAGIRDIPFDAVLYFRPALRELCLQKCTTGMLDDKTIVDIELQRRAFESNSVASRISDSTGNLNAGSAVESRVRLDTLIVGMLYLIDFDILLNDIWLINCVGNVDLCKPRRLEIRHTSSEALISPAYGADYDSDDESKACKRESDFARVVFQRAAPTLEVLILDTVEMGYNFLTLTSVWDTAAVERRLSKTLEYVHQILFPLRSVHSGGVPAWPLSHWVVKVAFWLAGFDEDGTQEPGGVMMGWVHELLQEMMFWHDQRNIPSHARNLRTMEVHVHVGGRTVRDVALSLSALRRYNGWSRWDEVISALIACPYLEAFERFVILVVVGCDEESMDVSPRAREKYRALENAILNKFGTRVRDSGKLSVRVEVEPVEVEPRRA